MSSLLTPEMVANLGSAGFVCCVLWWRINRVEQSVNDVRDQVQRQNGRLDSLETWRAVREATLDANSDERKQEAEVP